MVGGSVLVPLQLDRAREEAALLEYSLRTLRGAVYLHCTGPAATSPPTLATLDCLAHCLEPSAHCQPRSNVVPLLPFLGWSADRVAQQLGDVGEVVAAAEHAADCHALVDRINTARRLAGLPSVGLTLTAGHAATTEQPQPQQQHQDSRGGSPGSGAAQQQQQQQQQRGDEGSNGPPLKPHARVIGNWPSPVLRFDKVAVGGTFDRLHAGHRLLLAATALVSKHDIFVGITADQLLTQKKNRELLQSYEEREAAAVGYMRLVNPAATVVAGPLVDPKEPPLCAVDPEFDAIVVSEETVPGARAINEVRAAQGFQPLTIVVVGVIHSRQGATKLSSTVLRERDAAGGSPTRP